VNPYPGLRPFDGDYARFFFGRDRQISELIERLRGSRFVAVVGLSGSGKSSLVRAGLLLALRAGQLGYAGSGWRIATLRPSEQPVATLAAEFNKDDVLGPSADRAKILESSTIGLLEATKEGRSPQTNLLVFVDQFEDVFRLVSEGKLDAQRAAHFINLLLVVPAETRPDFPVYVVITLRSEYLGSCARFYGLPEALNRSQYLVPRLAPEQLREAIEAPAALMDVAFDPALVQRLQVEASAAPDELPRLQHLLMRLWEFRKGETITLDEYRLPKIGGLEQALDLHAEEVYATLTDEQKRIAQRVFQRLTTWDESSRDARRPTALHELAAVSRADPEAAAEVVRCFREAHFLTEIPAAGRGEPLVDITHESFIRHWKRLEGWAKEEARWGEIFRALARQKRPLWNEGEIREAIGWRDNLQPNETWAKRYVPGRLTAALKVLKHLELNTASARLRRWLVAGLVGAALILSMLSGWALRERSRAAANANRAAANANRAAANAKDAHQQQQNAQSAAANAIRQSEIALQRQKELESARKTQERLAHLAEDEVGITNAALASTRIRTGASYGYSQVVTSPSGNVIVTLGLDGKVRVFPGGGVPHVLVDPDAPIRTAAISSSEKLVATVSVLDTVKIWSLAGDTVQSSFKAPRQVSSIAFSGAAGPLLLAYIDGSVEALNSRTGRVIRSVNAAVPTGRCVPFRAVILSYSPQPGLDADVELSATCVLPTLFTPGPFAHPPAQSGLDPVQAAAAVIPKREPAKQQESKQDVTADEIRAILQADTGPPPTQKEDVSKRSNAPTASTPPRPPPTTVELGDGSGTWELSFRIADARGNTIASARVSVTGGAVSLRRLVESGLNERQLRDVATQIQTLTRQLLRLSPTLKAYPRERWSGNKPPEEYSHAVAQANRLTSQTLFGIAKALGLG
jgi:hypothetical protein